MTKGLRKITAVEFARRLKRMTGEKDKRFAVFLGAGCSVSSGIPDAGGLVRDVWLPQLRDFCAPDRRDLDTWAKEEFPDYDLQRPSASYGQVIERLFLSAEERQREIESLCEGKFPGFGYAVLSSLVASEDGHLNVALTTNFDDLMADALYLFSPARPLVIHHESLAGYIRPTRTRPLIVKLHGDNRLSPHNTADETNALNVEIEKQVRSLLHDRGLIFIGYGGNDQSIRKMLEVVPKEGLPLGVFWVSPKEPEGDIRVWLESRNAVWVEKGNFDELMLLVKDVFKLPHPGQARFDEVFQKYKATYDRLSALVTSLPDNVVGASAMKQAVKSADESFKDWLAVVATAYRLESTDPDRANTIYTTGLKQFPNSANLARSYALFLNNFLKNYDKAEEFYQKAIDLDPRNADLLGSYAFFLTDIRKNHDKAEKFFKKAIDLDPRNANLVASYAFFLTDIRKNHDKAEKFYRKAVDIDPRDVNVLSMYAEFLTDHRKDYDKAEELLRKAVDMDPLNVVTLGNYALFLTDHRKEHDKGEEFYRKALGIDPRDVGTLENYALFLTNVRKDHDKAEELFKKAIEVDRRNADVLGNYAGFLLSRGKVGKGLAALERVFPMLGNSRSPGLAPECWFYAFAHRPAEGREEALRNLNRVLQSGKRSPGWNLAPNIAQARKDGHPDVIWLEKLAAVISDGADIKILDAWPRWKKT